MGEYEEIKERMAILKEERLKLLSLTDITGGDKGFKENMRLIDLAEAKQKELMRLNKKLIHLGLKGWK